MTQFLASTFILAKTIVGIVLTLLKILAFLLFKSSHATSMRREAMHLHLPQWARAISVHHFST
jgi:hypothetical protein